MKRSPFCNKPFKLPIKTDSDAQRSAPANAADPEARNAEEAGLDAEIVQLQQSGCDVQYFHAYMQRLHTYNDLKDVGQALIGMLAERLGVTTKSIYEEYGLDIDD